MTPSDNVSFLQKRPCSLVYSSRSPHDPLPVPHARACVTATAGRPSSTGSGPSLPGSTCPATCAVPCAIARRRTCALPSSPSSTKALDPDDATVDPPLPRRLRRPHVSPGHGERAREGRRKEEGGVAVVGSPAALDRCMGAELLLGAGRSRDPPECVEKVTVGRATRAVGSSRMLVSTPSVN